MDPAITNPETVSLFVVDDSKTSLLILSSILREQGYQVSTFEQGHDALSAAGIAPPDLILLDITMPVMDGVEVCRKLRMDPDTADIPVIFVSGLEKVEDKIRAFDSGGQDYITKPFNNREVLARVKNQITMQRLSRELRETNQNLNSIVERQVEEITQSHMALILALSKLSESRDNDTGLHIERIQEYCKLLAQQLSTTTQYAGVIDERYITNLYNASPLHDIGKVATPDEILLKPGKLTREEFDIMKRHTLMGAQTLEAVRNKFPNIQIVNMGIVIARSHHERWDGSGYPDGLAGEEIPLSARILALADVYDALRSKRCYKDGFSHEKTVSIIARDSGTHFDQEIVRAFMNKESEFELLHDEMNETVIIS